MHPTHGTYLLQRLRVNRSYTTKGRGARQTPAAEYLYTSVLYAHSMRFPLCHSCPRVKHPSLTTSTTRTFMCCCFHLSSMKHPLHDFVGCICKGKEKYLAPWDIRWLGINYDIPEHTLQPFRPLIQVAAKCMPLCFTPTTTPTFHRSSLIQGTRYNRSLGTRILK